MAFRPHILIAAFLLAFAPIAAQAFSVRPSIVDLQAEAGKSVDGRFTILNTDAQPETFYLSAMAFTPQDESGSPVFDPSDRSGVASWIGFSSSAVVVSAMSKAEQTFELHVPVGTKSGGYYAAVLVSTAPADVVAAGSGANVQAKIAMLAFITVGGNNLEKVGLLDFSMLGGNAMRGGLWGTFAFRLQNQGDVHVIPTGSVAARDLFGRTIAEAKVNPAEQRLMPGTMRTFTGAMVAETPRSFWEAVANEATAFAIGPVTLHLDVSPGLAPETSNRADLRLWIIPWQLLVCVVVGVAVLYGLMKMLMRSKKPRP